MANPEHVKVVKQGKEAIDAWRREHPKESLNLSEADFILANLSRLNLSRANLSGANLSVADLSVADLSVADLSGAILFGADLSGAILSEADLSGAILIYTVFRNATVSEADFGSAVLGGTVFADCDLSGAINLDKAEHNAPSTIGIDTIYRSGGNISEEFLRGAGVPEEIIRGLSRLIGEIQYHSCFIAYGEPDKTFAEQLHKDFTSEGINSWLYSTDSTPGERTWGEIGQRRREAGKFIVICSAAALVRDGVLKEIEEQMDEDPEKIIPISRDKLWKEPGFKVTRGTRDLKPFLMERNYANFEEGSDYEKELNKLLKALERKQT